MKLNITIDDKTYAVDVEVEDDPHAPMHSFHPAGPALTPPAPAASSTGHTPPAGVANDKLCHSPIAGIVISIAAQKGQQLQANDLLLVLEAMKMETNVTAPVRGKVKDIYVRPGDGVKPGQVLVEFE